ncbi:zinc finger protein 425-like [Sabethes cyaneus]|uniref:zinc finger protein 425-like n=1 Tax=Sabethes cyaneus TaxID=53552 RepID=UPI00237EAEE4|nr:zinc finger protein 425-like [Sabethes cyaneus]
MSPRKSIQECCRICTSAREDIVSLDCVVVEGKTIAEMLRYSFKLEVYENDGLPYRCCNDCKINLEVAYKFVVRYLESVTWFKSRNHPEINVNGMHTEDLGKSETEDFIDTHRKSDSNNLKISDSDVKIEDDEGSEYLNELDESVSDDEQEQEENYKCNIEEVIIQDGLEVLQFKRTTCGKGKSPKRCCRCRTHLKSMEDAQDHSKKHLESKINDPQKVAGRPFECSFCFKRYAKLRTLVLHQKEMYIEKPFKCKDCEEDFTTDVQLREHRANHGKDKDKSNRKGQLPKCCACYEQFETDELMRKHAEAVHFPESQTTVSDNDNQFACDVCNRRYKTKRILLDHKSKPYRTKQYQCSQCGRIFRDKCALSDHERCHQGERPFVCTVCSKSFAIKDSFRKHVRSHTIEEDRFKCEICGKGFKTKGNLKDHHITHASDYRPLSCSLCSATFARKSCLKSHMRMHTGEKPFKCNLCEASYAFSSDLKRHIMAHKGIKPYICSACGRGYPRQDYLRKHMATHNQSMYNNMSSKIYTLACRICTQADVDEMDSLYDTIADEKTPAQVIEELFGIVIKPDDGLPTKYCQSCKEDLGAALRFRCRLQEADTKFSDLLAVPKIEITEPVDGNISSVFISEIFIKAEEDDQTDCEEMPLNDDGSSVEAAKPRIRRKSKLQNKRKKKSEDIGAELPEETQEQEQQVFVDKNLTDEDDVKPDVSKPAKKRWTELKISDCSSSDDNFSDYDDSGQSSDSDAEEKPKKKRLYYGVKADSLPKRCCSCKDLPLDSHEKVQEHSDKYHYRYRITNAREIEDNPFECLNCYKRFDSKKEFLRHQRKMYVERLHPCPKCDEEFANHYVLQRHLKLYHKKKMIIERMEELRQESHICCACKKKFDTSEQLKAHAEEIHLKERHTYEGDFEFECEVCYRRFKTRQSMKVHQYRMFKGKKFICALCGKAFKEKAFLRDHENSHRREKPYECPKCDARFSIKGSYDAHVRLHDAKEEFKCEYCGRGFRTKSLLKGHLTVHSEDRPFKCHLCPITFTQQRLLDSHIEFHLGNKPFKCQQCPASYRYQRDLRGHIREKHEGILSFQCTYCPKAFNRKKPLMVHLKTHEAI